MIIDSPVDAQKLQNLLSHPVLNQTLKGGGDEEPNGVGLASYDKIMGEKKTHEVAVMSREVRRLASDGAVEGLIDLGSGKGYLSQVTDMYKMFAY